MSNKILITGGTGFLGSYIIKELLDKNYQVRVIRRRAGQPDWLPASTFERVEWVDGDILDIISLEDALEGIDTVIHSAAVVSFSKSQRKLMYQVNVDGTANIVNMAIEKKIGRFVYISSVAALGRTADGSEVDEDKKWEESPLNTHYAISKQKAEMEVWRGMGEGLNAVILNPSTIIGYGNWNQGSSALFQNIYREFPWYTEGLNGFVDVEDVARATVQLMESEIAEQRFIINGDNWTFKKLFDTIADHLHKKRPSRLATPLLGSLAWRVEKLKSYISGKKPALTRESARVSQTRTRFRNNKILEALPGFRFTPLDQTIAKASAKYLEQA